MRVSTFFLGALAITSGVNALPTDLVATIADGQAVALEAREPIIDTTAFEGAEELFKRKGGGGRGGRGFKRKGGGGGGGRGSSSGSSSSSSGSSSSSSSGGRSGTSSGSSSSGSSSSGTRTSASPSYGGGRYYGGGATSAYRTGSRSAGGISPLALGVGLGLGFGLYGLWLYSVYSYPYSQPWKFHNSTTNTEESKPVICLCEEYSECGCDDNTNSTYQAELLGNGSYDALNKSVISVADINGTSTIVLNGTLPNGTLEAEASATASGASASSSGISSSSSGAPASSSAVSSSATDATESIATHAMMKNAGYWALSALVGAAVFLV